MSYSEENSDPLSDWMVLEERTGEFVTDVDSESSDSSIEVVNIEGQDAVSFRCHLEGNSYADGEDNNHVIESTPSQPIPSTPNQPIPSTPNHLIPSTPNQLSPLDTQVVEADGGLGACCMELIMMNAAVKNTDEEEGPNEEAPISVHVDEPFISNVNSDPVADSETDDDSGDDSDFVCLDANNLEELIAENQNHGELLPRVGRMERSASSSSSIGPSFNFLRQEEPVRHDPADDLSDRDSLADLDDDTESSLEDAVDDRIESEQSEAGSEQSLTDIGDLSSFADIGDLPLEVGNVARNYIHRPNNHLSSLLNITIVLAAILTMGMSLGIIMAGDLEIEEWQRLYTNQVKKTLETEDRLYRAQLNLASFDEVMTAYATRKPVASFITSLRETVSDFRKCNEVPSHTSWYCQRKLIADMDIPISDLKKRILNEHIYTADENDPQAGKLVIPETASQDLLGHSNDHSSHRTPNVYKARNMEQKEKTVTLEEIPGSNLNLPEKDTKQPQPETASSNPPKVDVKQLHQSLTREQDRALRWQQLYLHERRLREREMENERLEDERERALWEKEDEEEDRRLRKQWEQEEAEEDKMDRLRWEKEEAEQDKMDRLRWEKEEAEQDKMDRLRWEKEEAEQDRMDRLRWEKEEAEEDRKDRERWERERGQVSLEACFTAISANLTSMAQNALKWNSSRLHDFANLSKLMLSVAQLKQSVVQSVQQLRKSTETIIAQETTDNKNDESISKYLQDALKGLKSEVDSLLNFRDEEGENTEVDRESEASTYSDNDDVKSNHGTWRKAFKNLFKVTSKSLRRFGRELSHTWKNVKSALKGKKAGHDDSGRKESPNRFLSPKLVEKVCNELYLHQQKPIDIRSVGAITVGIDCQCARNVRHKWYKIILKKPCQALGLYSYACNVHGTRLRKEMKQLRKSLEKLMKDDNIEPSVVSVFGHKARKRRLEHFQDFWDVWGDHDLLMKSDREWARCKLKWWSSVCNGGSLGDNDFCKSVSLYALFEGLVAKDGERTVANYHMDMTDAQASTDKDTKENAIEIDTKSSDIDIEVSQDKVHEVNSKKFSSNNVDSFERINSKDSNNHNYDDDGYNHDREKEKNLEKITYLPRRSALGPDVDFTIEDAANDTFGHSENSLNPDASADDIVESDEFSEKDWLLERAQRRLQFRRDKEKASWLSDSDHKTPRGNVIKEDRDKSPEWFLERSKMRKVLRKQDHETDWMFDRARQRREMFQKKWAKPANNKDIDSNHHTQQRKKFEFVDEELPHQQKWHKKHKEEREQNKPKHGRFKKHHDKSHKEKMYKNKKGGKLWGHVKRFVHKAFGAISKHNYY